MTPSMNTVRSDLVAELAARLEQLDHLLGRLEDAERQAASASEDLMRARHWQEETLRAIQDERAQMRTHQRALDSLADRTQTALAALAASHRSLPPEVHELAIELQVLQTSGLLSRRPPPRTRHQ
ncbi:hypothetical protein FsymDg_4346 [Candidatus Protofrankia datiscae]|uniref:Uncharacterized protein n=2 Tax=Frankiaceae TaxID=74712 RepID=F8AYM7_9ACTN|nr:MULTISPECIES: hypothetical protein [Protofrankia]AEH11599.1 hypothetical protein FsymDg_4346 [Candidatus Protofrankia datiscae]